LCSERPKRARAMALDDVFGTWMNFEHLEADPRHIMFEASQSIESDLLGCIKNGNPLTVLAGTRRAGKTHALKRLSCRNLGVPTLFVDISKNFFDGVQLVDEALFRERWLECLEAQLSWDVTDTPTQALADFLFGTLKPLGAANGVLVLDEFDVASLSIGSTTLSALFLCACSLAKVILIVAGTSILGMNAALHGHTAIQPARVQLTDRVTKEEFAHHFPKVQFPVNMQGVELTFADFHGVPGHLALLGKSSPAGLLSALLDRIQVDEIIHASIAARNQASLLDIARDLLILCAEPSPYYQPKLRLITPAQLAHLEGANEVIRTGRGVTFSSKPLRVALRTHYHKLIISKECNLHEQIRTAGDRTTVGLCIDLARARVLSNESTFSSAGIEVDLKPAVLVDDKELEFAHTPVLFDTPYLEHPGGSAAQAGSDTWFAHGSSITFIQNRAPRVEFAENGPKGDLPKILEKARNIIQRCCHVVPANDKEDIKVGDPEVFGVCRDEKVPFDKINLSKDYVSSLLIEFGGQSMQIDVFYLTLGGMAKDLHSRLGFVHALADEAQFKALFGDFWTSFVRNDIVQSYLIRKQDTSPGESWSKVKVVARCAVWSNRRKDSVIHRFVHVNCPLEVLQAAVADQWPELRRGVLSPPVAHKAEYTWDGGSFAVQSAQATIAGLALDF
jgi:hypothetical protein